MSHSATFAYVGARLQARHGRRPTSGEWERLERIADFGHFVQTARGSGLEPFVRYIATGAEAHEVERALRVAWRRYSAEVADWQPAPWRPGVRWTALLPELPVLHHLLAGRPALPWMTALPSLGEAARHEGGEQRRRLAAGPLAPLLPDQDRGLPLDEAWARQWRRLLPPTPSRYHGPLQRLERDVRRYRAAVGEDDGPDPEEQLDRLLTGTFRRHTREPVAAYAHLGLVALDFQRLRAGLLTRRLFGSPRA